jgi:hypothetical protein
LLGAIQSPHLQRKDLNHNSARFNIFDTMGKISFPLREVMKNTRHFLFAIACSSYFMWISLGYLANRIFLIDLFEYFKTQTLDGKKSELSQIIFM